MKKETFFLFFLFFTLILKAQNVEDYYSQAQEIDFTKDDNAKKAIMLLNKAIEMDSNFTKAILLRAKIDEWQGLYDKEIMDLTLLIKNDSLESHYYMLRAKAFVLKKEAKKAIDDFTKAFSIDTSMVECIYVRGLVYTNFFKGKKDKEALIDFNYCINQSSINYKSLAYVGRGTLYEIKGDFTNALNEYNTAIKINPLLKEAYLSRGILKINLNQDGCNDLLKYRDLNGTNAQDYLNKYCYK